MNTRTAGIALALALIPAFTEANPPPPSPRALGLCSGGGSAVEAPAKTVRLTRFNDVTDPPMWWSPQRRDLAAALLAAGDAKGAANEARAALSRRLRDPVSLNVLARAERKLGMVEAADTHLAQARKGWVGDVAALEQASS